MRTIFVVVAVVLLSGAPAFAAEDPLAGYYGNTLVVSSHMFSAHVHYRANHTLDMSGTASGKAFSTKGSWKIDDKGQICRNYKTTPPTYTNPFCTAQAPHKVGDTWLVTDSTGVSRNLTMVSGIQ